MRTIPGGVRPLTVILSIVWLNPAWAVTIHAPGPRVDETPTPPGRVGTRLAWRTAIPLRNVDRLSGCHLLDGILYATGSDGYVHALKASTGQILWSRPMAKPPTSFHPPFPFYSPEFYGVGFTLSDAVVILDPQTGSEYKRIALEKGATATATSMGDTIFAAEAGRHVAAYELKDNYQRWHILTEGPISVPPIFLNDLQTVFIADGSGLMAMVWASDKEEVYVRRLGAEPQGWVGMTDRHFIISTSDNFVRGIEKLTGETAWQFRLPGKPEGGPLVVNGSVYQKVAGGGVQRISQDVDRPIWFQPDAARFLAEWDGQAVLLMTDGRITVIDPASGQPAGYIDDAKALGGVSNTANGALIVTSPSGEIRCLQPLDPRKASLAEFAPPSTQPATQPANPPLLARADQVEENDPIWVKVAPGDSATAGNDGGSGRRERSARSSGEEGGRGDRSSRSSRSSRGSRGERSSGRSSRSSRGESGGGRSSRSSRSSGGRSGRSSRGSY